MRQGRFTEGAKEYNQYPDSDKKMFFMKNQALSSSKFIANQFQSKGKKISTMSILQQDRPSTIQVLKET